MGKQVENINIFCVTWLVLCMISGVVCMVWLGSGELWHGYAAFGIAFIIGLLPSIISGTITEAGVRRGFFAVIFLLVIQTIKVIFMIFAFILTLGCMRCAGKRIKPLR